MAETSKFWDGVAYSDDNITGFFEDLVGSFVIPGRQADTIGDELRVTTSTTNGKVTIKPGEAFILGTYYVNDDDIEVSVNSSVQMRIDYIVLRRDTASQEIRPYVIEGIEGAVRVTHPAITDEDFVLGWVSHPTGYNAATTTVSAQDIHDLRTFFDDGFQGKFETKNMIPNAEFLGWSGGANSPPDGWVEVGTATISSVDRTNWKARGRDLWITGDANEGIEITIPVSLDPTETNLFTLSGYLEPFGASVKIEVYKVELGVGSTLIHTWRFWNSTITGSQYNYQFMERIPIEVETPLIDAIRIRILTVTGGADAYVGLLSLVNGYLPVAPVHQSEIVFLENALTDAAWNGDAKSTADATIDLSANFQSLTLPYMRGVIARVRCRDSGSAAAADENDAQVEAHHPLDTTLDYTTALGIVSCAGLVNDSWAEGILYFPFDHSDSTPEIQVRTVATGAGTLDVTIEIIGYIT